MLARRLSDKLLAIAGAALAALASWTLFEVHSLGVAMARMDAQQVALRERVDAIGAMVATAGKMAGLW